MLSQDGRLEEELSNNPDAIAKVDIVEILMHP
jgi:hypothetical protein